MHTESIVSFTIPLKNQIGLLATDSEVALSAGEEHPKCVALGHSTYIRMRLSCVFPKKNPLEPHTCTKPVPTCTCTKFVQVNVGLCRSVDYRAVKVSKSGPLRNYVRHHASDAAQDESV